MTSKPMAVLLAELRIGQTLSRPQVCDNPFSEAAFKTFKYCPAFPERFANKAPTPPLLPGTVWINKPQEPEEPEEPEDDAQKKS
jgi:hypothetical protein